MGDIKLTDDQRSRRSEIEEARLKVSQASSEVNRLISKCEHVIVSVGWYGGTKCLICKAIDLGWYCPDSPDHLCDYDWDVDDEGFENEGGELCKHCGSPEERK